MRLETFHIGILEDASWEAKTIALARGDTLAMYTSGITEAQNLQDEFFDDHRLLSAIEDNLDVSALALLALQEAILAAADQFQEEGAQCDDETLLIVKRQ